MITGLYSHFSDEELAKESILQSEKVLNAANEEELEDEECRLFIIEALIDFRKALAARSNALPEPEEAKIFPPRRIGFPRAKYAKQRTKQ